MSSLLTLERPTFIDVNLTLAEIERHFQFDDPTQVNPTIITQDYNISSLNDHSNPAGPVLPSPYGASTAWQFVSQSGDAGAVDIAWEGYCGFTLGCTLVWLHPGQTTVVLDSVNTAGVGPTGAYRLLFTIVSC